MQIANCRFQIVAPSVSPVQFEIWFFNFQFRVSSLIDISRNQSRESFSPFDEFVGHPNRHCFIRACRLHQPRNCIIRILSENYHPRAWPRTTRTLSSHRRQSRGSQASSPSLACQILRNQSPRAGAESPTPQLQETALLSQARGRSQSVSPVRAR